MQSQKDRGKMVNIRGAPTDFFGWFLRSYINQYQSNFDMQPGSLETLPPQWAAHSSILHLPWLSSTCPTPTPSPSPQRPLPHPLPSPDTILTCWSPRCLAVLLALCMLQLCACTRHSTATSGKKRTNCQYFQFSLFWYQSDMGPMYWGTSSEYALPQMPEDQIHQ